ncbi:MAG: choice-of-anchor J domain-containing protein [Bacteroidales bacterium]|nr:choice-of-anchor J domain-containing protein [Bacteroidales bacterium]
MKKLLFSVLLLLMTAIGAVAQTSTITVNDGDVTNQTIPLDGFNADGAQHNQMLYLASDLSAMSGQEITEMVFYFNGSYGSNSSSVETGRLGTWTISLGETDATTLSSLDNSTTTSQVYQGIMTWDHTALTMTITFDNSYVYNGGNLLVDFNHAAASWNRYYFLGVETTEAMSYNSGSKNFSPKTTFVYQPLPTCPKPATATATGITSVSADIAWTAGGGESEWALKWGLAGFDVETAGTLVTNLDVASYSLTGLTGNTEYDVYVKAVCGEGDESVWKSVSFRTACDAITTFPWSENFDGYSIADTYTPSSRTLPTCWNYINECTYNTYKYYPTIYYYSYTDYSHSSPNSLRLYSYYSSYTDYDPEPQYIILPSMENLEGKRIDFWARGYNANSTFKIGLMTDPTDASTFVQVGEEQTLTTSYQLFSIGLIGSGNYIAIMIDAANSSRTYNGVYIDDITVREPSTAAEILTYSLPTQVADATIDSENGEIAVTVAFTTDLNALAPVYTISENAEISAPVVTVAGNGESCTIEYDVTAEDGTTTKHWTVTVTKAPVSHDAFITAFTFAGQKEGTTAEIVSENDTYTVDAVAEWNADLTTIAPAITISDNATVDPESGASQDFTSPVTYTVTAEDGTTIHAYTVTIVNDPDACINPTGLQADDVTAHTATLNWVHSYTETSYLVKVSSEAMTDMTATADVFDGTVEATTKALEGLNANTKYFVYVQSVCENVEGWVSANFTTLCDAIAEFPFTEGFELTTRPGCWTEETTGTHYWTFGQSGSSSSYTGAHSGSYNASYRHVSSGDKAKLVSPVFDFGEITGAVLEFWRKNPSWAGDIDYLKVYYRTAGDAEWTLLESYTDASSSWKKESITLVNLSSTYQIAFEATDNYGYGMGLDDVLVREASHAAEILTYSLPTEVADANITSGDDAGTIEVTVANSTDFDVDLTPTYTISENAEISDPVVAGEGDVRTIAYTVTAEAGNTKDWTVTVTKAPISHDAFITAFTFAGQKEGTTAEIVSENDTYTVNAVAVWNANLTAIAPEVAISNAATVVPASGDSQDFTNPVTYTVTAEDGTTTHAYTVTIVNDPDACINPATVNVTELTTTTATLSWEQAYTETSYLVKVSTEAMTDMTATADVFDGTVEATTKALEGLTANTQYFVYVQSDCENAEGWTSTTFYTLCNAITEFPWTENFESYEAGSFANNCWVNEHISGSGSSIFTVSTSTNGSNSTHQLQLPDMYSGTLTKLVLPEMNFGEVETAYLFSIDVYRSNSTYNNNNIYEGVRVFASTDGNIEGATEITFIPRQYNTSNAVIPEETAVGWYTYRLNIPITTGTCYIILQGESQYCTSTYMDNFVVRARSNAAEIVDFNFPTRMTAPVIDNAAATVTATASYQADLENLGETVTVSDGAEYVAGATSIEGNVKTFAYTVTAEDGTTTKNWTVTVTKAESASTANDIVAFSFVGQVGESAIDPVEHTVTAYAEWDFDLENNDITPTIEVSPMATISNDGEARNFFGSDETPVQYTVTAEDGTTTQIWNVTIVNDPNACVNPDEITVENVTSTGATLSWDKMYQETSYIVKVSTVAYGSEEELLAATEFVYNDIVALEGDEATLALTDLTPATYYYVYVQSNCENAESWTVTYFGTECDGSAYSVPFVETFDMSSNSVLCWTIIDANNDAEDYGYGYYNGEWNIGNFVNGGEAAYIYSSSNDAEDWLISPKIAVVDGAYLTFDYKGYGYYTEKFSVYVMDAPANYAEATQILATQIVDNADYESIANIDLSAYADQDIYIGIKCESDADQDALFIDNFKVILPTYTITATAGENGTIDPASAEVMYGYDKTFTITPAEGYRIAAVVVDAETEGEANVTVVAGDGYYTYTFTNVTANHTIHATFEAIPTYTITVNAGENGNVYYNDALVSAPIVVTEGATPEFEITPATGYQIDVLTVGGNTVELTEQQLGGFTYTFEPVMADITLAVTFEAIPAQTYTITVNAGENGTVTYNDEEVTAPVVVNEGDTPAFVITPAENYQIDVLSVDETPVELTPEQLLEGYTYTFAAVEGDHTLTVTFVPVQSADMLEAGSMSIYPNPNNGMFSIDFSNIEGDATYQIIDARGAVVETRDINVMNGETLNFNHDLRPGAYFVRIINGDKVYVEQIVVE